MNETTAAPAPWYRDRWPWIIIAAPAISAVLGIAMLVLALESDDGLVAADYYKQGLTINEVLDKEAQAQALHMHAKVQIDPAQARVRVRIEGDQSNAGALSLRLAHPTRAGEDQQLRLRMVGVGLYEAPLQTLAAGHWHVMLEDEAGTWRLTGEWQTGDGELGLAAKGSS
ncbi:MAG TPA: FixH family protein [Burkholderiales bacterium]|jgi:uncharacterized protein|nr:FixH family protein [Burkholderiales bacterium]